MFEFLSVNSPKEQPRIPHTQYDPNSVKFEGPGILNAKSRVSPGDVEVSKMKDKSKKNNQ
jgi:hypothetical protein